MFEKEKRTLGRLPTEPVQDLSRKAAIELFRTAKLDYLQLSSTMPVEALTSIVWNTAFKLKKPADLVNAVLKYAAYTGATASNEKQDFTISYNGQTFYVKLVDQLKSCPKLMGEVYFITASLEAFIEWYINTVLLNSIPSNSHNDEK